MELAGKTLAVFLLTVLQLEPLIAAAWRVGALDIPRDWRRMHRDAVPRVGGIAVFFAWSVGAGLFCRDLPGLAALLIGGAIVFSVSLADDLFGLPAWIRLFFQFISAALAVGGSGATFGGWSFAAVLWVVALTNAHNFIDGLDGLFAGCSAVEGIGLFLILRSAGLPALAPLLLSAACLGFRTRNATPARLFAGDCGSGTVGFLLAVLALPAFSADQRIGLFAPFFVFAYPIADLSAAVLRRGLHGKSVFLPDRGHFHHRLAATGLPTVVCGRILIGLSALTVAIGFLLRNEQTLLYAAGVCLVTVLFLFSVRSYVLRIGSRDTISGKLSKKG